MCLLSDKSKEKSLFSISVLKNTSLFCGLQYGEIYQICSAYAGLECAGVECARLGCAGLGCAGVECAGSEVCWEWREGEV